MQALSRLVGVVHLRRRRMAAGVLAAAVAATAMASAAMAQPRLRWHGCPSEFPPEVQCASLMVPLNYRHPSGPRIRLGFDRLRAADRAHRVGSLIVNPGGPGGAGSEVVAAEAA